MKPRPVSLFEILAFVLLVCSAGCTRSPGATTEIRVFAASSLVDVITEAGQRFEAEHPGVRVTPSVAGSQILASQILEGAPADVFASADRVQMQRVAAAFAEPAELATNRLVLVTPAAGDIERTEDLTRPGLRVVIASEAVPAGRYAMQALDHLGLSDRVEPNVVSYEHDVRGVLSKVLLAVADAGFVYATDAASAGDALRTIPLPPEAGVRATYLIAVRTDRPVPDAARSFVEFMRTGGGAAILREHGFETPRPRP